jgi:hypothetical protein
MADGAWYDNIETREFVAIATLRECHRIFSRTSIIQNLDRISFLHGKPFEGEGLKLANELDHILDSLDSRIIDAVRISICFENFFKMKLLLGGYVIHNVNRNVNKKLADKQLKSPVEISELGDDISKILSATTIGWKVLVRDEYKKKICVPSELFDSLEAIVERRNKLHYLMADNEWFSGTRLDHLFCIRTCFQEFVVTLHNELLGKYNVPPVASARRPVTRLGVLWDRLVGVMTRANWTHGSDQRAHSNRNIRFRFKV